jgi:hypothetical protein
LTTHSYCGKIGSCSATNRGCEIVVEYRTKDDVNEIVELLCKLNQSNYEYICIIISQFLLTQKGEEQD